MLTTRALVTVLTLATAASVAALASTPDETQTATQPVPVGESRTRSQVEPPRYGPIHATDPVTIAEIKALYDARRQAMDEHRADLAALRERVRATEDRAERQALQLEAKQIRHERHRTHCVYGLQIAKLNEDQRLIEEFTFALDFLDHPERYRPAPVNVERSR